MNRLFDSPIIESESNEMRKVHRKAIINVLSCVNFNVQHLAMNAKSQQKYRDWLLSLLKLQNEFMTLEDEEK